MRYDIIYDIRQMNRKCYNKHGNISRGVTICLDTNSEVRLAAHLAFELANKEHSAFDHPDISDVLERGIRHLDMTILGMKLRFDCESLCIEDADGKVIEGLQLNGGAVQAHWIEIPSIVYKCK